MNGHATLRQFDAAVGTLRADRWQAWRIGERQSYPIALDGPETLSEAVNWSLAAMTWNRGETLAVQHSHAGLGAHTLWLFTVKRSSKNGTWRAATDGGRKVFVGNLEPHLLSAISLAEPFAPVEPFDAFRGDPVGRDFSLVEQRS